MPFFSRLSRSLTVLLLSASSLGAHAAIDINKASADQLRSIKGIGPHMSARIMDARQKAHFKSWSDLIERIDGLGHAKAARLSAQGVTVAGAAFAATDSMVTAVAPARKDPSGARTPAAATVRPTVPPTAAKPSTVPPALPSVKTMTPPSASSGVSRTVAPAGPQTAARMSNPPSGQAATPSRPGTALTPR